MVCSPICPTHTSVDAPASVSLKGLGPALVIRHTVIHRRQAVIRQLSPWLLGASKIHKVGGYLSVCKKCFLAFGHPTLAGWSAS